jgi:hypothetical protein
VIPDHYEACSQCGVRAKLANKGPNYISENMSLCPVCEGYLCRGCENNHLLKHAVETMKGSLDVPDDFASERESAADRRKFRG